jgi:hypothetical protein
MPEGGEAGITVNKPLAGAHQSALQALAGVGAVVKQNTPTYVEGRRPNKMGLMVGSGGETIKIWLSAAGAQTQVKVTTEKSFAGMVGQKSWDSEVLAALR